MSAAPAKDTFSERRPSNARSERDAQSTDEEKAVEETKEPEKDESEYPSGIKLFLILISIYLAAFLNALVSHGYPGVFFMQWRLTLTFYTGPNDHCYRHSQNH
jgi:hypothetical protein